MHTNNIIKLLVDRKWYYMIYFSHFSERINNINLYISIYKFSKKYMFGFLSSFAERKNWHNTLFLNIFCTWLCEDLIPNWTYSNDNMWKKSMNNLLKVGMMLTNSGTLNCYQFVACNHKVWFKYIVKWQNQFESPIMWQ